MIFRGMEPEIHEKKLVSTRPWPNATFCSYLELFFIGGDLGVHNQCAMADGENVYYRGEGICNLVLATEKVIILFLMND